MARTPSPVTSDEEFQANQAKTSPMHKTQSSHAIPSLIPTPTTLTKDPHSRRVIKSKTCHSLLQKHPYRHQQGDIELATEIGHGLLLEVQKLQGQLQKSNDSLTTLSLEKVDAYQEIERLTNQLKQRSDALDQSKEEIWSLELEKQELTQQVSDLQQQVQRVLAEQTKQQNLEQELKQELEQVKLQQATWQEAMEKAEQDKLDLAITRRKLASVQRQLSNTKSMMIDASHMSFAGPYSSDASVLASQFSHRLSLPPDAYIQSHTLTSSHTDMSPASPKVASSTSVSALPAPSTTEAVTESREAEEEEQATATLDTTSSVPLSPRLSLRNSKHSKVQQHQQQHRQRQQVALITVNMELQASLRRANESIQALQTSLQDEQKKRTEMEILWREAQDALEHGKDDSRLSSSSDLATVTTSTASGMTETKTTSTINCITEASSPSSSPSSTSVAVRQQQQQQQQQHKSVSPAVPSTSSVTAVAANARRGRNNSKEFHNNRQKCLSLGDELSLAGSQSMKDIFSQFKLEDTMEHKDDSCTDDTTAKDSGSRHKNAPQVTSFPRSVVIPATRSTSTQTPEMIPARPPVKEMACLMPRNLPTESNLNEMMALQITQPLTITLPSFEGDSDKPGDAGGELSLLQRFQHFQGSNDTENGEDSNDDDNDGYDDDQGSHHGMATEANTKEEIYGSLLAAGSYIYQSGKTQTTSHKHHNKLDTLEKPNATESLSNLSNTVCEEAGKGPKHIRALTRTMIGDWVWKYTRKVVGSGISENRHLRFFSLHPYSKTLSWSSQEPGSEGSVYNTKCVLIESFMVINDGSIPSFYIQTSGRDLKIQCQSEISYRDWFKALKYLFIDVPPLTSTVTVLEKKEKQMKLRINHKRLTKILRYQPPNGNSAIGSYKKNIHIQTVSRLLATRPSQHLEHDEKEKEYQQNKTQLLAPVTLTTMSAITPPSPSLDLDFSSSGMANLSSASLPARKPMKLSSSLEPIPNSAIPVDNVNKGANWFNNGFLLSEE